MPLINDCDLLLVLSTDERGSEFQVPASEKMNGRMSGARNSELEGVGRNFGFSLCAAPRAGFWVFPNFGRTEIEEAECVIGDVG